MENIKGSSEGEDIPSDFFDDFNKEDFIQGLSVIDSWDEEDTERRNSRINTETLDRVQDLRELIVGEHKEDTHRKSSSTHKRSNSENRVDDFIRPGSRRDPNKTNEAIKKDKEMKVKEYLAKHLESSDDLRPPGTELDDFYEDKKNEKVRDAPEEPLKSPPRRKERPESPRGLGREPLPQRDRRRRFSPHKYPYSAVRSRDSSERYRNSQRKRDSQERHREVYDRRRELAFRNRSPKPYRNFQRSPKHDYGRPHRSPPRYSPSKSERKYCRSPEKFSSRRPERSITPPRRYHRSRSRSPKSKPRDDFLYPNDSVPPTYVPNDPYKMSLNPQYPGTMQEEYLGGPPTGPLVPQGYDYQAPVYSGYNPSYEYVNPPAMILPPQPVPAPVPLMTINPLIPLPTPSVPMAVQAPQQLMISAPEQSTTVIPTAKPVMPMDALAKLVADGKLSHEDYLKLAPNKGVSHQMDTNTRVGVLSRCHSALNKLASLMPPNRLVVGKMKHEQKAIAPQFCSPLKRQPTVEFSFTKSSTSAVVLQNKHIIDSIISRLGLDKVVGHPKKTMQSNQRDAAVQTTSLPCDMCEIRRTTLCNEAGTCIDQEHFSSSIHTQVMDEDLYNSKSVFNPSGSIGDGAPMSIAHMTPAQLVSQLAARAKTLKQSDQPSNQFHNRGRYDGRDDNYRNNYSNNYRF